MISAGFGPPYASAIARGRRMASRGALTGGRGYVNEWAHYDLASLRSGHVVEAECD